MFYVLGITGFLGQEILKVLKKRSQLLKFSFIINMACELLCVTADQVKTYNGLGYTTFA